jgi:hypothetical protein
MNFFDWLYNITPPLVFDLIRWLTVLTLASGVVLGITVGCLFLMRRTQPTRWANSLFAVLLFATAAVLTDKLFSFSIFAQQIMHEISRFPFLPLYVSFAPAPLLFYYVKSRLYPNFQMHRRDFKHFIMPTAQFVILLWLSLQGLKTQVDTREGIFSPFYGNLEKGIFIVQMFLYLYFSYRFILHERAHLARQNKTKTEGLRRKILVVGWLKRMVKALFIVFGVHSFFILSDYFSFKIWSLNLQTKSLFSAFYELSFALMLFWLCLNGYFALRRKL